MAVVLSGAIISREKEKALLNRSSDIVITGNENSRAIRSGVEKGQIETVSLDTICKDSDTAGEAMQKQMQ
jgi:hypothetical protein